MSTNKRIATAMKQKANIIVALIFTFVFYAFVASQIPYMLDDWNWGIEAGINSFFSCDQNSRFAGNFIILLITRSTVIKTVLMATVETAIPVLMVLVSGYDNNIDFIKKFIVCNILILCMPASIWSQTYGWASGFANFVTSALLLLIHIIIIKKFVFAVSVSKSLFATIMKMVGLSIFALVSQLFIENLTIYFIVLYLCIFTYLFIKDKNPNLYVIAILVGLIIGCIFMFSSSIYDSLISTGTAYDDYRNVAVDMNNGIVGVFRSVLSQFGYNCMLQVTLNLKIPSVLLLLLSIILLIIKRKKLSIFLALANAGTLVIYVAVWFGGYFIPYRYKILFSVGYFCLILLNLLYIFCKDKQKSTLAVFLWISVIAIVFPLSVTTATGERLWLSPLIMTYIVILNLISELFAQYQKRLRIQFIALGVILCFVASWYVIVYSSIGNTSRERTEAIQVAVVSDSGEVHLPAYKYTEYLWWQDPVGEYEEIEEKWPRDYKYFYDIPQDFELYVVE